MSYFWYGKSDVKNIENYRIVASSLVTSGIVTVLSGLPAAGELKPYFHRMSNLKVKDDCAERPDVTGMVLMNSQLKNVTCVDEVKGEDKISNSHAVLCDSIKIGCFCKEAIDTTSQYGILGVHVVGFQVTFYVTFLLAEGLYVMYEVCSIRMPTSIYEMKSFIANSEDVLPIKAEYKQCLKKNDKAAQYKRRGAVFKQLMQCIKLGRNRKRHCPIVYNH